MALRLLRRSASLLTINASCIITIITLVFVHTGRATLAATTAAAAMARSVVPRLTPCSQEPAGIVQGPGHRGDPVLEFGDLDVRAGHGDVLVVNHSCVVAQVHKGSDPDLDVVVGVDQRAPAVPRADVDLLTVVRTDELGPAYGGSTHIVGFEGMMMLT